MIEVNNLSFGYDGAKPLFAGFNWTIAQGESWAIIGPSGCGKTTLLYLLAGLRRPKEGMVNVQGETLLKPRQSTGLILQDYGLLPWATARENVELGLKLRPGLTCRRELAEEWMERLGILAVAEQYPSQLSGGQRQRVAIARTLALEPDILLMDEPFSSLDALTREGLQNLVIELGIEASVTSILVTHSIEEAVFLGRRVLVLSQPPISSARVVDNPEAGNLNYRGCASFYARCNEVRLLVEEAREEVRLACAR